MKCAFRRDPLARHGGHHSLNEHENAAQTVTPFGKIVLWRGVEPLHNNASVKGKT
jgi:hypothetical protein